MVAPSIVALVESNAVPVAATSVQAIKIEKPQGDRAITVKLGYEQNYKLDLSAISGEKITLVHIGEKLIILFDNKSTVTVEPFFDSMDAPLPNVTVQMSGQDLTSSEFTSSFLVTSDQSVLTGYAVGQDDSASGADFHDPSVDPLDATKPLPLLGQEEVPGINFTPLLPSPLALEDTAPSTNENPGPNPPPARPPITALTLTPSAAVVHDESAGIQTAADPNPANDVAGSALHLAILTLFNNIGAAHGSDPDVSIKDHGAIGFAASVGDLVTLTGGGNAPTTVEYKLNVTDATFSGISTTEGTQIFLYNGSGATEGLVLGRVGIENGTTDIASPSGQVAFALAVDSTSGDGYIGQYLSLHNPLAGSSPAALDDQISIIDGAIQIQAIYDDGIGNQAMSTPINIGQEFSFQDDGPTAVAASKHISSAGHDTNLMLILDVSGSMGTASGLTGLTRLDVLKAAVNELFEQYGDFGNVRIQLVDFATNATQVGTDWMTISQAKIAVSALISSGTTNYDAAMATAESIFTHAGKIITAGVEDVSYFMSDGEPNQPVGSVGINASEESTWTTFLDTNHIDSFALGMGTGVTQSALDPFAYNGLTNTNANSIVVTDLGQLSALLVATVVSTSGNLLTDSVPQGSYGADGGYVKSITADGTTYTYDPAVGGSISVLGTNHGAFDLATHTETITFVSGGVLAIDMDDGSFNFVSSSNVSGVVTDIVPFVLADNDGDTAANTLTIVDSAQNHPPITRDDHVFTNISGGNGTVIAIPDIALLFNDSDQGGQAISVTAISNIVGATSVTHAVANVIFVDNNFDGGSFTYTGSMISPASSDVADVIVNRGQTGSTLTGIGLGEILIGRDGTNNIINANSGNDVLIGGNAIDTLNGGAGNDLLVGNGGSDTLVGGTGADHFLFNAPTEGMDHIVDFSGTGGDGDTIDIVGSAFNGLSTGVLSANLFASNAGGNFTNGTQRFALDTTTMMLYYDSDSSGSAAKIALAHLENSATLSSGNIHVI